MHNGCLDQPLKDEKQICNRAAAIGKGKCRRNLNKPMHIG